MNTTARAQQKEEEHICLEKEHLATEQLKCEWLEHIWMVGADWAAIIAVEWGLKTLWKTFLE